MYRHIRTTELQTGYKHKKGLLVGRLSKFVTEECFNESVMFLFLFPLLLIHKYQHIYHYQLSGLACGRLACTSCVRAPLMCHDARCDSRSIWTFLTLFEQPNFKAKAKRLHRYPKKIKAFFICPQGSTTMPATK